MNQIILSEDLCSSERDIICGLMNRIEQISMLAGDKFPLFSLSKTDVWILSNSGSWMGGFWCGLQQLFAKYQIGSGVRSASANNFISLVPRLEPLMAVDSVHTSMVFWYGAGEDYWQAHSALPILAQRAAVLQATRFDEHLGFIPLGQYFAAGPMGAAIFSVDSLSALIKLLVYSNDPHLDSIARQHTDFYIEHCIKSDGACFASWQVNSDEHELAGDWSRGQAWAIYGLVAAANAWGDERYLLAADRALNYWLLSRGDVFAPNVLSQPEAMLDPSASVIVALAMYEFSENKVRKYAHWFNNATQILNNVLASPFLSVIPGLTPKTTYRFCGCAISNKSGDIVIAETVWGYYLLLSALQYKLEKTHKDNHEQCNHQYFNK